MKKLIFGIFICIFLISLCSCGQNLVKTTENLPSYNANLVFDNSDFSLSGTLNFGYFNQTGQDLSNLKFNIYANAFRQDSAQKVISASSYNSCYYNGPSWGDITILSVEGQNVENFAVCGADQNILQVDLKNDLQNFSNICLNIDFEIQLPNISHRFGYGENTINFGNFLPTLCVFENGNWVEIIYHSNGDPFYSEVANYNITISYPEKYVLASSGQQIQTNVLNNIKTTQISAQNVRDFAFILSEKFEVLSQKVGDTEVKYYYFSDQFAEQNLEFSTLCLTTYNKLFGNYPYPVLSVAQADFCIGGMEFPNLIFVGCEVEENSTYQYVIAHEIAHQWWYGMVGNNQSEYGWLDEGLTEFSTALFFKNNPKFGQSYQNLVANANQSYNLYCDVFSKVLGDVNTSMNRSLTEFSTEIEYVHTAYTKGFLLYDSLSQTLGEKTVIKCLKNYLKTYAFSIATPQKLIQSFEKTTSANLEPIFNSWISGEVVNIPLNS